MDPHPDLVAGIQHIRDLIGKPVIIRSGSRCRAHNATLPGAAPESKHMPQAGGWTWAADLTLPGCEINGLRALWRAAACCQQFVAGGTGVYVPEYFVHVDVRPNPSSWGEIMVAGKAEIVSLAAALAVLET